MKVQVTSLAVLEEGMKARMTNKTIIPTGIKSSINGGGGNGGRTNGRINSDAVKPTSITRDTKLK